MPAVYGLLKMSNANAEMLTRIQHFIDVGELGLALSELEQFIHKSNSANSQQTIQTYLTTYHILQNDFRDNKVAPQEYKQKRSQLINEVLGFLNQIENLVQKGDSEGADSKKLYIPQPVDFLLPRIFSLLATQTTLVQIETLFLLEDFSHLQARFAEMEDTAFQKRLNQSASDIPLTESQARLIVNYASMKQLLADLLQWAYDTNRIGFNSCAPYWEEIA